MSLSVALRTLLLAETDVTDLVGQRVKPQFVPQDTTYPAVSYFRVDTAREASHDTPLGLLNARYQFDAWATTPDEAEAVGDAVISTLAGYRGTTGNVAIGGIIVADERDGPYEPGAKLFRRSVDLFIWARE